MVVVVDVVVVVVVGSVVVSSSGYSYSTMVDGSYSEKLDVLFNE